MIWIKVCGMTNLEDALAAVEAGADAVGFVFYEKSPRNIGMQAAREIAEKLPDNIDKVGVFVNEVEDTLCDVADRCGLTAVQMHGDDEDPRVADRVAAKRPELKILPAISMSQPGPEARAIMWQPEVVHAFLVDSGDSSKLGGTGQRFDWAISLPALQAIRRIGNIVAAGGLTPANVAEAVGTLKPWGVDVVSGVEASPGKKDPAKVRAFVEAVRMADKSA